MTPAPAAEPIGRLRQPLSGQPLRQRCASSLRGAPVVTTRPKPRPASDCRALAQVTDPSDGLPAAAGNPGKPFAMHPPQAGHAARGAQRSDRPGATRRTRGAATAAECSTDEPTRCSERHRGQGRAGQASDDEVGTRAGVVFRVRISSRFAQAIGTDRNTDLKERHQREGSAGPGRPARHRRARRPARPRRSPLGVIARPGLPGAGATFAKLGSGPCRSGPTAASCVFWGVFPGVF